MLPNYVGELNISSVSQAEKVLFKDVLLPYIDPLTWNLLPVLKFKPLPLRSCTQKSIVSKKNTYT